MASNNSAKPILVAGAIGTVALLAVAWMFAASTSSQAVLDAEKYAEMRSEGIAKDANFNAEVETTDGEPAPADTPVAALATDGEGTPTAEAEEPEATETAEAETPAAAEEPKAEEPAATETPAPTETAEAEAPAAAEEPKAEEPAETAEAEAPAAAEEPKAEEPAATETPAPTETAEAEAPAATEEPKAEEPAETAATETPAATESTETPAATETAEATPAPAPVETASIDGDAAAGAKVFRKCKACHRVGDGAQNAVGPQLTGIIGRTMGSSEGFKYSSVFEAANEAGKVWTPEELDAFLTKPKKYMPGTKMSFAGLRKDKDRANVIAYLAEEGK